MSLGSLDVLLAEFFLPLGLISVGGQENCDGEKEGGAGVWR